MKVRGSTVSRHALLSKVGECPSRPMELNESVRRGSRNSAGSSGRDILS
jgi:hypothetical protein